MADQQLRIMCGIQTVILLLRLKVCKCSILVHPSTLVTLLSAVKHVTEQPIRWVVSSHSHADQSR